MVSGASQLRFSRGAPPPRPPPGICASRIRFAVRGALAGHPDPPRRASWGAPPRKTPRVTIHRGPPGHTGTTRELPSWVTPIQCRAGTCTPII